MVFPAAMQSEVISPSVSLPEVERDNARKHAQGCGKHGIVANEASMVPHH